MIQDSIENKENQFIDCRKRKFEDHGDPLKGFIDAPDHTHLSLASEAVKRRLSSRSRSGRISPKPSVFDRNQTLFEAPTMVIQKAKSSSTRMDQINDFFASPVPKLLCGPDDDGRQLFGALMEYQLFELLAPSDDNLLNLAGWVDDRNILIDHSTRIFDYNENLDR